MRDQQQRNRKPERKLPQLARRDTQVAPAIERIDPKSAMQEECAIEDEAARIGLPRLEQDEARSLKRLDRANTESVMDEMRVAQVNRTSPLARRTGRAEKPLLTGRPSLMTRLTEPSPK